MEWDTHLETQRRRMSTAVEWPTLFIGIMCYAGFITATGCADAIGLVAAMLLLTLSLTLFSSFSHEVLHGHPFRQTALNEALVFPALGMLIPYGRFRDTHLAHHHDPKLTDPYDDPETNFVDPDIWQSWCRLRCGMYLFNNTLLGRLIVGPFIGLWSFYVQDAKAIAGGDRDILKSYSLNVLGWVPVGLWLIYVAQIPFWAYLACVYLSHAVLKIRTFLEHRAHEVARCRSVIIEDKGPLAFLFLNNNLHAVHHARPGLPWYRLPSFYKSHRAHFLARNGGYYYRSYAEIFLRYLLWAKDPVPHHLWHSQNASHDADRSGV